MKILGYDPDPWQVEILETTRKRMLLNCSRQAGKSTVVAVLALAACRDRWRRSGRVVNPFGSAVGSKGYADQRLVRSPFADRGRDWRQIATRPMLGPIRIQVGGPGALVPRRPTKNRLQLVE